MGATMARYYGTTFVPGMVDQAFGFDGIDDYMLAPDTGLPYGSAARTLDFWMQPAFNARIPVLYGDLIRTMRLHTGTRKSCVYWHVGWWGRVWLHECN